MFKTAETLANSGEEQARIDFKVSTGKIQQKDGEKPKTIEYQMVVIKGNKSKIVYF